MPPRKLSQEDLAKALEEAAAYRRTHKIEFFIPYPKQLEFFNKGLTLRERLLMAGNQLGKTEAGAVETTYHMTGLYPSWWKGRRFTKATKGWIAGESSLMVRDTQQKKLCGEPGVDADFGTGYIPKHLFVDKPTLARGVTDAYDTIQVRHVSGGTSIGKFKSYEQGKAKFQAATLDWVWWDEEPEAELYSEGLTRINATQGLEWMTFTPLKGMSNVVIRFLNEPSIDRGVTTMVIEDADHIPPDQRQKIVEGYLPHEREARARGIPLLGSGKIFQIAEEAITEPSIENLPTYWAKLWAIDFGIGHPFAAVLLGWDKDNDVIHILHGIRMTDALPIMHAAAMKPIGASVPVAWPQDGTARDKGSGIQLAQQYKSAGLHMLPEHATWPDGSVSTEAGIMEMQERMLTGRFKVVSHLASWFEEFRMYHRKDGQIVKVQDDLMSATRIGVMMKRFARAMPLGHKKSRPSNGGLATGIDFDIF